jgi:hypothetical protein
MWSSPRPSSLHEHAVDLRVRTPFYCHAPVFDRNTILSSGFCTIRAELVGLTHIDGFHGSNLLESLSDFGVYAIVRKPCIGDNWYITQKHMYITTPPTRIPYKNGFSTTVV